MVLDGYYVVSLFGLFGGDFVRVSLVEFGLEKCSAVRERSFMQQPSEKGREGFTVLLGGFTLEQTLQQTPSLL